MLRTLAGSLALALAGVACNGRGPTSPTAVVASPSPGLSWTMVLMTQAGSGPGLRSPVSILARFSEATGLGGAIEDASFRVLTSDSRVLVDAKLTAAVPIPARGQGELNEKLEWSSGEVGQHLEATVTVRDGNGATQVFTRTFTP